MYGVEPHMTLIVNLKGVTGSPQHLKFVKNFFADESNLGLF